MLTQRLIIRYLAITLIMSVISGCGLKFGSEARQAAENADKSQRVGGFVEVDNTAAEPEVVTVSDISLDKKDTSAAKKQPEIAAHYVRIGKNRRLKTELAQDLSTANTAVASSKLVREKKTDPPKPKPLAVKNIHGDLLYPRVQLFGAKLDESEWIISSTELQCFLTQPIPRLGKAVFIYNPVQKLRFVFEVNHPVAQKLSTDETYFQQPLFTDKYPYPMIGAKLESIPPEWKPFSIKKILGYIPLKAGYKPFVLPHRQTIPVYEKDYKMQRVGTKGVQQVASLIKNKMPEIWPDRLMYELDEGMSLRFTYRDFTDGTQDIITSLSPINFSTHKVNFEKCIKKLPIYHFEAFKKTMLFFNKGQKNLSKKMRLQLKNMVKFVKLDEEIKKVMIKSYTDSTGFKRINRNAAKLQAQAIKRYMRKLGMNVPITAIGIGEGPFVASNRSAAGRAKNRRSIITLIK